MLHAYVQIIDVMFLGQKFWDLNKAYISPILSFLNSMRFQKLPPKQNDENAQKQHIAASTISSC